MNQCEVILSDFREIQSEKNKTKTRPTTKSSKCKVAHVRHFQDILIIYLCGLLKS